MKAGTSIIVLALVLTGCSGDSIRVARTDLPKVVLQPDDLPGSFERFDEGRQASADKPDGARADATRFGRIDGWKSRYRRRGGVEVRSQLRDRVSRGSVQVLWRSEGRARRDRARAGSRTERPRSWGRSCGRLDNPGRLPSPAPNVRRFLAERQRGRDHHSERLSRTRTRSGRTSAGAPPAGTDCRRCGLSPDSTRVRLTSYSRALGAWRPTKRGKDEAKKRASRIERRGYRARRLQHISQRRIRRPSWPDAPVRRWDRPGLSSIAT